MKLNDSRIRVGVALLLCLFIFIGCKKKEEAAGALDPNVETCNARLVMIDGAKQRWAEQNQKTANDTPAWEDLKPFMRNIPTCPSGGTYTIGKISEAPTCSIPAHNERYKKDDAPVPAPK